jgi:hypothetical protein
MLHFLLSINLENICSFHNEVLDSPNPLTTPWHCTILRITKRYLLWKQISDFQNGAFQNPELPRLRHCLPSTLLPSP